MKTESTEYSFAAPLSVVSPRFVIALSFDDANTDITYLTSHDDCLDAGGVASIDRIDGCVISISGQSQKVSPDNAQHTIGSMSIKLLDVNNEISTKIYTKLVGGDGLRKKRIEIYQGFEGLPTWSDYSLRVTFLVDAISNKDGTYTISCSDIQRTAKTSIFDIHQGVLTSSVTDVQTTIPVTIADAENRFPTIEHDANYSGNPSATVSYIKIDDEIICHSGWTDGNFNVLQVVERGALNTIAAVHAVSATNDDQKKKVEEYIYLEMASPRLVYAILTGLIDNQAGGMPSHWHLGIDTQYVTIADFRNIGADLWNTSTGTGRKARFMGIKKQTGKSFIETDLLLWMGAFMPVYSNGAYGLKRLQGVLPNSPYAAYIDETQVVSYSSLVYDQKSVINNIAVKWNWLDNLGIYSKTTALIDTNSIAKHGNATLKEYDFRGVFTGLHTDADIQNYFNQIRDRYAAPPLRLKVDVLPKWGALDVGDTVKLSLPQSKDYNSNTAINRTFEVQQVMTDWQTGKVSLDLFGGVEPASQSAFSASFVMDDAYYTSTGTELSTVLTISAGAVTASATLTGGASSRTVYYYDGDLTINSGVTVSITNSVELRIKGSLTINGAIDGAGAGFAGGASSGNLYGTVGTSGATGHSGISRGLTGETSRFLGVVLSVHSNNRNYNLITPPTITSLNILNPDGLSLTGIEDVLAGSSGSAGDAASTYTDPSSVAPSTTIRANGGAGGNSGAGLVIIARGGSFGASGSIDLSGEDGGAASPYANAGISTMYSGAGVGGSAGALLWLMDGDGTMPSKNNLTINSGATPVPSVDVYVPISVDRVRLVNGQSAALQIEYVATDQIPTNVSFRYLPSAQNGFVWFSSDESATVAGGGSDAEAYADAAAALALVEANIYADGLVTDSETATLLAAQAKADLAETQAKSYADGIVSDEEARAILDATNKADAAALTALWSGVTGIGTPADNATANQSDSTTNSAISTAGTTATWVNVTGTGKPANNATANQSDATTNDAITASVAYVENGIVVIKRPGGGTYSGTDSGMDGAIKITLPVLWTNTMMSFVVDVYNYSTGGSFSIQLSGYNHSANARWINMSAILSGSTAADQRVRFGHDGSKACIFIGEAVANNNAWNYPKVTVRDFMGGHNGVSLANWQDGWSVGLVTTTTGFTVSSGGDFADALLDAAAIKNQGALATSNLTEFNATNANTTPDDIGYIGDLNATNNTGALADLNTVDTAQVNADAITDLSTATGGSSLTLSTATTLASLSGFSLPANSQLYLFCNFNVNSGYGTAGIYTPSSGATRIRLHLKSYSTTIKTWECLLGGDAAGNSFSNPVTIPDADFTFMHPLAVTTSYTAAFTLVAEIATNYYSGGGPVTVSWTTIPTASLCSINMLAAKK